MAIDSVSLLGKEIGTIKKEQGEIKENINPDSAEAIDGLEFNEAFKLKGTLDIYKKGMIKVLWVGNDKYGEVGLYPVGPYCVLDHEDYGMLDNCLLTDGSDVYSNHIYKTYDLITGELIYAYTEQYITMPITMPLAMVPEE